MPYRHVRINPIFQTNILPQSSPKSVLVTLVNYPKGACKFDMFNSFSSAYMASCIFDYPPTSTDSGLRLLAISTLHGLQKYIYLDILSVYTWLFNSPVWHLTFIVKQYHTADAANIPFLLLPHLSHAAAA